MALQGNKQKLALDSKQNSVYTNFRKTDTLSETESRKKSWLEIANHFGECGPPLLSPVGPI